MKVNTRLPHINVLQLFIKVKATESMPSIQIYKSLRPMIVQLYDTTVNSIEQHSHRTVNLRSTVPAN